MHKKLVARICLKKMRKRQQWRKKCFFGKKYSQSSRATTVETHPLILPKAKKIGGFFVIEKSFFFFYRKIKDELIVSLFFQNLVGRKPISWVSTDVSPQGRLNWRRSEYFFRLKISNKNFYCWFLVYPHLTILEIICVNSQFAKLSSEQNLCEIFWVPVGQILNKNNNNNNKISATTTPLYIEFQNNYFFEIFFFLQTVQTMKQNVKKPSEGEKWRPQNGQ